MVEESTPAPKKVRRIGGHIFWVLVLSLVVVAVMGALKVLDGGQFLIGFGSIMNAIGVNQVMNGKGSAPPD